MKTSKKYLLYERGSKCFVFKTYQADKANLAQLTQILQQMGAALGEFSNSYTQADNKAMDLVHKYLGK